jgi:hypothetical protein
MRGASLFAPRTADELAVLAADRQRTADHHAAVVDIEREANTYTGRSRPMVLDHYIEHLDKFGQRGPSVVGPYAFRSGDHITTAPAPAPLARPVVLDEIEHWARYACRASTGGSLHDGGAWAVASHVVHVDHLGRESIEDGPTVIGADGKSYTGAVVYVAAVAQPADVRAMRLRSVRWFGGTGRIEDPDAGALADRGHSTREAGAALVGADGCNLTRTTADGTATRERWTHLRAERAADLHALAGTDCPPYIPQSDRLAIVGAMPGEPRKWETRYGVAIDIEDRQHDGTTAVHTIWRTRPLRADEYGQYGPVGTLAHTARWKALPKQEDPRTGASRTVERAAAVKATARHRRIETARAVAVKALAVGRIEGRSHSLHVRLARGAAVVSFLSSAVVGRPVVGPTVLVNAGAAVLAD